VLALVAGAAQAQADRGGAQVISRAELLEAMRAHGDYNLAATTNGPRFQIDVFFTLARRFLASHPQGGRLFIRHQDWFEGFLEVSGLTPERAPVVSRRVYENGQDIELDCRPGQIVRRVRQGPRPRLALNVKYWWEKSANPVDSFSYLDTASTPVLKVTNSRIITFRLVDLGDQVLYDDVSGLTGRPTTGFLGLLFKIIGEGRIVRSQMAFSDDGVQVSRVVAKKLFSKTVIALTWPDGRTEGEIPSDRTDLVALKDRLDEPIEIDYHPLAD